MRWDEIFEYRAGSLYWLPRGRECFESDIAHRSWTARRSGKRAGTISSARRARVRHIQIVWRGSRFYAHRIIWEMHFGKIPAGMQIDHIDGNGTNNHIGNLRLVTAGGNRKNQPLRRDSKTGLFGVSWNAARHKYEAYINTGGRRFRLGLHDSLFDAACVRKSAEIAHGFHGNHGRLDDINEGAGI